MSSNCTGRSQVTMSSRHSHHAGDDARWSMAGGNRATSRDPSSTRRSTLSTPYHGVLLLLLPWMKPAD
jgi:hypothetical protein